ncbi:hypothetical protein [Candidatus Nitrospira bockiana]
MSGPFTLRYLHLFLREKAPGAFILSRNGKSADWVGSSGDDLAEAVRRAAQPFPYRYFWFAYTSSAEQAYELEHAWLHRYRPTDNSEPPAGTRATEWKCTVDGCAACALATAK